MTGRQSGVRPVHDGADDGDGAGGRGAAVAAGSAGGVKVLLEFLYALASLHEGYSKNGAELRSRVRNASVWIIIEALF